MTSTNTLYSTPRPVIHRPSCQEFAPGTVFLTGNDVVARVSIAGAGRWRLRGKFTLAGTLTVKYARPGTLLPYDGHNPAAVNVAADTEFVLDETTCMGEADLLISFAPTGADSAVEYLDVMGVTALS